jgi:penicillin-binding protein 2
MDVRDHGFFVFFAPRDNPQIAGVVFAEHGAHGSDAAFIAKHAIETFFAKRDGLPLPVLPPKANAVATPLIPLTNPGTRNPGTPELRNR